MISIGIDTGGTYTDAVAVDLDTGEVLAKGKSPTTKEDLSIGIDGAMGKLPEEYLKSAGMITISTTLATNACVEDKGGRAKLVLIGMTEGLVDRINTERTYGIKRDAVLCVDANSSFDGRIVDDPDWETVIRDNVKWFEDAEALSIAAMFAMNNGGAGEKTAKAAMEAHFDVPVVAASDLANELDVLERGATAMLNARLLPVIREFMTAVESSLERRQITARPMVIRSDGSLISHALARTRPVETIVSGPAASVLGGHMLARAENSLIIDMGGTTTDISLVKSGAPKMASDGIHIGNWTTQVKGVFVDTFALGGDSAIRIEDGKVVLNNRRVLPYCAAAARWPHIKTELEDLLKLKKTAFKDFHEFLYIVKDADQSRCTEAERNLLKALADGPRMIDSLTMEEGVDKYRMDAERLESDGVIMRCGLTPTDMMHIKGLFDYYDEEASDLAASFFIKSIPEFKNMPVPQFADYCIDRVCQKLYENVMRVLLADRMPRVFSNGLDSQTAKLISESWNRADNRALVELGFSTPAVLVGVGAPIHVFLPRVAEVLGTSCVIPEHAEVANAVGAATADVSVTIHVEIYPIPSMGGSSGYTVHWPSGMASVETIDEARAMAAERAKSEAILEARRRGALGELRVESGVDRPDGDMGDGSQMAIGLSASATATGRIY